MRRRHGAQGEESILREDWGEAGEGGGRAGTRERGVPVQNVAGGAVVRSVHKRLLSGRHHLRQQQEQTQQFSSAQPSAVPSAVRALAPRSAPSRTILPGFRSSAAPAGTAPGNSRAGSR